MASIMKKDDYLLKDSEEYISYIQKLKTTVGSPNSSNLCLVCWCFLSWSQKKNYISAHEAEIKTPSEYGDEADFINFATKTGHFIKEDDRIYYKIIFPKPLKSNQNKKLQIKQKHRNYTL